MGRTFAFILHGEDFNTDYISKYKDQKTFSYFDSEFLGQAFLYETKQRENIAFLYSEVRVS